MRIGLDYDGTFTEDNSLWIAFVNRARERGHSVVFVTARADNGGNDDIEADAQLLGIEVVYCNARPKAECFKADVWIDDNPSWIPSIAEMEASLSLARIASEREAA